MYDTRKNGNIEGILRGLPALLYCSFSEVTYPKQWLQLADASRHQLYPYSWHQLQDIDPHLFELVAATTQYYEDNLSRYSQRSLVNQYSETNNQIVVIGDAPQFELAGTVRPFREDPVVDDSFEYEEVYSAFKAYYDGFDLSFPLKGTKNLFLQDNALLYTLVTDDSVATVEELIDILPEAPYLPIVRCLSTLFTTFGDIGSEPLESQMEIEELGKWLRRRIELDYQDALDVARKINDYASTHERMYDPAGRKRMSVMTKARKARQVLDTGNNPIHARYYDWITEAH